MSVHAILIIDQKITNYNYYWYIDEMRVQWVDLLPKAA